MSSGPDSGPESDRAAFSTIIVPGPPPWYRRRRLYVAAAVIVALVVGLVVRDKIVTREADHRAHEVTYYVSGNGKVGYADISYSRNEHGDGAAVNLYLVKLPWSKKIRIVGNIIAPTITATVSGATSTSGTLNCEIAIDDQPAQTDQVDTTTDQGASPCIVDT